MTCFSHIRKIFGILCLSSASYLFAASDLVVTNLSLNPAQPDPGQSVQVSVTIQNQGTTATPNETVIRTGIQLNGSLSANFIFVVVEPGPEPIDRFHMLAGESFTASRTLTWPTTGTSHTVSAHVDDLNAVSESNESNNTLSQTIANPPDLIVENIWTVPANPQQNQVVSIHAQMKNQGTGDAAPSWSGVYVDNVYIGKIWTNTLAPNGTWSRSLDWTPTGTGNHNIRITADYDTRIAESNESNNSLSETVNVQAAAIPDLIVEDLWTVPASPTQGQSAQWFARVRNIGTATATSGAKIGLYTDNTLIGDLTAGTIAVNGTFQGSIAWTPSSSGTISFRAEADRTGLIGESNEANNSRIESVSVQEPPQADLVVEDVWISPSAPSAGQSVTWFARIRNQGNATAPSGSRTGLYINNVFRGDLLPGSLAPNATHQGSINWTPATDGSYTFRAEADRLNAVTESNEANNQRSETFAVSPPAPQPDLVVTGLALSPTNPAPGSTVTATVVIKNEGPVATPNDLAFRTGLRLNGSLVRSFIFVVLEGGPEPFDRFHINPNESFTKNLTLTWPTTGNTHTLLAEVDDQTVVAESNEFNNSRNLTVTTQPDLVVEDVWVSPSNPEPGDAVQLFARVRNVDNGTAASGGKLGIFINNSLIGDVTLGALAPNATQQGSVAWTVPSAGSFNLRGQADRTNLIAESNETNNTLTESFTVIEPLPDLVVLDIWTQPASPIQGANTQWFARIENQGNADLQAGSDIGIYVAGVHRGDIPVGSLAVDQTFEGSLSWTPTTAGNFSFEARADDNDEATESNETNNNRSETITIQSAPQADLIVEDVWISPSAPIVGDQVSWFARIRNQGNATAAAGSRTGVYINNVFRGDIIAGSLAPQRHPSRQFCLDTDHRWEFLVPCGGRPAGYHQRVERNQQPIIGKFRCEPAGA